MPPIKPKPKLIEVPQEWNETCQVLRHHVAFVTEALGVMPMLAVDDMEFPAITNGTAIIICPSKWNEIRDETKKQKLPWFPTEACGRAVVILHELVHNICKHTSRARMGHRDENKWRIAADFVTNEMVVDILRMPPFNYSGAKLDSLEAAMSASGCYDKKYHGKTVEEVYEMLPEEQGDGNGKGQPPPNQPPPQQGKGGGSDQQDKQQPQQQQKEKDDQDKPDKNEDNKDDQKPQDKPNDQDQQGDKSLDQQPGEGSPDNGSGEGPSDISDMFGDDLNPGDAPDTEIPQDISELVDNALQNYMERHGHKMHAPNGSYNSREIEEAAKKPPVRLEDVLRKIRDCVPQPEYRYQRIGKNDAWMGRRGMNLRMPVPCPADSKIVKEMVFAIDASGSMSPTELIIANRITLDSLDYVAKHQLRRLVFTVQIEDDCYVKKGSPIPAIRWTGGTRIDSIIDHIEKEKIKPSVIILVTDAEDSEAVKERFSKWRYLSKLRTIIVRNPRGTFPGITFHVDTLE